MTEETAILVSGRIGELKPMSPLAAVRGVTRSA